MIRPRNIWLIFAASLAVMLAVMGWVSWELLRLDRTQARAQQQAQFEEAVRLALWRMDAAAMAMIAQESARPYAAYTGLNSANSGNGMIGAQAAPPSDSLPAMVHFQFDATGRLSSPQVELARSTTQQGPFGYQERLITLQARVDPDWLRSRLPAPMSQSNARQASSTNGRWADQEQPTRNMTEFGARQLGNTMMQNTSNQLALNYGNNNFWNGAAPTALLPQGPMQALWAGDSLLLARRVGGRMVQGCWLDWAALKAQLLATCQDLLPRADLIPAENAPTTHPSDPAQPGRMLASLPVRLVPGELEGAALPASPLRVSLLAAWACLIVAACAVGLLLFGAVSLGQRRGDFATAVTHELRTPLTTFRLYTEMLADDKVRDDAKRAGYLATLRREAERLSHLVENVLAYAGLDGGRSGWRGQSAGVAELLERVTPRLADRAEQAQMTLTVEMDASVAGASVSADADAVEHILFNLVDNACKYAAAATDRRIHLRVARAGSRITLSVADHGPGLPPHLLGRRLFRPFSKSARQAADSAPGIGLGLSLSLRLARRMAGQLRVENLPAGGACFVLTVGAS